MKMNLGMKFSQKTLGILLLILIISVALLLGMYLRKPLRMEGFQEGAVMPPAKLNDTTKLSGKQAPANAAQAKLSNIPTPKSAKK